MLLEVMKRLDHFMAEALAAYYNNKDPLGRKGDFTTAPEISQLFGEIIGIWAAQKWFEMGSPKAFNLIELGPGRGTLLADLLRATKHVDGFHTAASIYLVETSEALRQKQKDTLCYCEEQRDKAIHTIVPMDCRASPKASLVMTEKIRWHGHLNEVPTDKPIIIIANEFFDALPIRQFKFENNNWLEHYIDDNKSVWQVTEIPPLKSTLPQLHEGAIYEYSHAQEDYANLIANYSGCALIIDYGYLKSAYGDSLQAMKNHRYSTLTVNVGTSDITSHIDFEWLSSFFKQTKMQSQRDFLTENGIAIRYKQLNNPVLLSGYERLIHPEQMGDLFKVMEVDL
jgi:NADH dehydrogenase [ubiquinone] 1 alpha subcomplex assembly factor 7